jgi:hypothetical protein
MAAMNLPVIPAKAGIQSFLAACALLVAAQAQAAGGHHAVDDAAILEPGQCELESWFSRARGERSLHAGAGCRVGPLELGLAADHARPSGAGSQTGWGLQAKWATEVADGFSVGVAVSPAWAAHARPRLQGFTLAGLATWQARETLALHLNLGRDFVHRGSDDDRYGIAAEWAPAKAWSLVGERYREEGTHFVRAGVRWAGGEHWSVDLSRAHRLHGPNPSHWTLGATLLLDRR